MPGRFALTRPIKDVAREIGLHDVPASLADEPARANVAPGQEIIARTADGLQRMRWGLIPVGRVNARGRPVLEVIVNARGETVFSKSAFWGVGRALVPADCWYEWTGKKGRKTPWRIRDAEGHLLVFAAITDVWQGPGGISVPQVATVTCDPNRDVAPVHDRMGVLLAPEDWDVWLHGTPDQAAARVAPWPAGRLVVETAEDVDFDGP